jgi:DNA mismatch repair protein MutL
VQKILDTLHLELDSAAVEILRGKKDQFEELGFDYNIINNSEIDITGIPNLIKKDEAIAVFKEIIDELRLMELEKESKVMDNVYATIACHNAFRTGDFVNTDEAHELIRQMDEYEVFSCPHGRPVRFSISFSKLDSFFKRR